MVNAAMNNILFFGIANHKLTIVGTDGAYIKPLISNYIVISPGQTIDFLLEANQSPNRLYYIAAKPYNSAPTVGFDETITTGVVEYNVYYTTLSSTPLFPNLPNFNDTTASTNFTGSLRSLASKDHPIHVPIKVKKKLFFTLSVNTLPCPNNSCAGPRGNRFAASINNKSFVSPDISILEAYYYHINGIYGRFPSFPPLKFNFTADDLPVELQTAHRNTTVKVLKFNSTVEIVFQGTNLVAGIDHPMHLHGHSFYVVGWGLGNFDSRKDPLNYNLVDPPLQNTIAVPKNGWAAIRFKANNPGKLLPISVFFFLILITF